MRISDNFPGVLELGGCTPSEIAGTRRAERVGGEALLKNLGDARLNKPGAA